MSEERVAMAEAGDARLRAALASLAEVAGDGSACPPAGALWDAAAGRCDRGRLEAVVLHLGECAACATAWRLAREIQRESGEARVLAGPPAWFRRRWVRVAALAAALVLAAGLALQLRTTRPEAAPEFRGQEGDWLVSLVPETVPLAREACRLRWTAGPSGTVYDVRVTTEDLAPIARRKGWERAELLIPPEALSRVPPGGRLVWQVRAHLPDGGVADSRTFVNEVH